MKLKWDKNPKPTCFDDFFLDQLFMIRPDLIKRISGSVLRDLLDGLQGHQPPVLNTREAEEILQSTRVLRDQVTSLIDIVYRKGEKACDIMLSMLEDLDNYLYRDLVP